MWTEVCWPIDLRFYSVNAERKSARVRTIGKTIRCSAEPMFITKALGSVADRCLEHHVLSEGGAWF